MVWRNQAWKWAVALAVLTTVLACSWSPTLQNFAGQQVDVGLKRSLLSFATARGLNAVISAVQGTELSVEPLGVGVTLTLGQVLDPLNDLVEQFSTLMLWSSVSFGLQMALLTVTGHWLVSVLLCLTLVAYLLLWIGGRELPTLGRVLVLLLLARFAVPCTAIASDFVYRHFLAQEYAEHQKAVDSARTKVAALSNQQNANEASKADTKTWLERIRERVSNPFSAAQRSVEAIKATLDGLAERIVRLMAIFLLQTLLFPLAFLWFLYRLALSMSLLPFAAPEKGTQAGPQ